MLSGTPEHHIGNECKRKYVTAMEHDKTGVKIVLSYMDLTVVPIESV